MKEIYNLALGKCAEVGVKQSYKYYVGEFKMYCEMYEQEYHAKQQ